MRDGPPTFTALESHDSSVDSAQDIEFKRRHRKEAFDVEMNNLSPKHKKIRKEKSSPFDDGMSAYISRSIRELLFGSYLNWLMLFFPIAFFTNGSMSPGKVFTFALLAIAPFAERLGYVTEQVAIHTNDTVGGLLNATFGNVTELVICIFALREGLLRVVQVSLLGSVLSNMLLVLGTAFFVGGLRHSVQRYSKAASTTNSTLLLLSATSVLFVAVLSVSGQLAGADASAPAAAAAAAGTATAEVGLSRFLSVVLLCMYGMYLLFQLKTHTALFEGEAGDDDEDDVLGFWGAIFWLTILTIIISILSDILVDAIKGAAKDWGVSTIFISAILIPIIGNAAEHASAVIFAYRNKMDISLGVAVGSATQIATFVIPFCVVMAWWMEQPLSLYMGQYETICLLITVIFVAFIIQSGESNWLSGMVLVSCYIMVAVGFWYHIDEPALN